MLLFIRKQYAKKVKSHTEKHGYDAVGVALAVVFFITILLIPLGLFIFIFPRIVLEQDVQQFANTVRLDGYVREEVYEEFAGKLENRGYSRSNIDNGVQVFVIDSPLAGSDPRFANGSDLIQSGDNTNPPVVQRGQGKMGIQVTLPANSAVFRRAVENIGGEYSDSARTYNIARVVMSEAVTRP